MNWLCRIGWHKWLREVVARHGMPIAEYCERCGQRRWYFDE